VDALHKILKRVELTYLGGLNLIGKPHRQVLRHDAVARAKKGNHHLNKVAFVVGELCPVGKVKRENKKGSDA